MRNKDEFPSSSCQISEAQLEVYLFGLMPAQIAGQIYDLSIENMEDHLLICPSCQQKAEAHIMLTWALKRSHSQIRGKTEAASP